MVLYESQPPESLPLQVAGHQEGGQPLAGIAYFLQSSVNVLSLKKPPRSSYRQKKENGRKAKVLLFWEQLESTRTVQNISIRYFSTFLPVNKALKQKNRFFQKKFAILIQKKPFSKETLRISLCKYYNSTNFALDSIA